MNAGPAATHPLPLRSLLDPRPADAAERQPCPDAVNIPLDELPQRTAELPPRGVTIPVVGSTELVRATVAWLRAHGRMAEAVSDAALTPPDSTADRSIGRLWRPNAWLERVAVELMPGVALDLGCGGGREAVYLAAFGWRVTAIDQLAETPERCDALARRYLGPDAAARISSRCADLEAAGAFEALRAECGPADLVVMCRYLNRPLLARAGDLLRAGGSVVVDAFTTLHRARHGRPAGEGRAVEPGELPTILDGRLIVIQYDEGWHGDAHTARVWARMPASPADDEA